jgi:carbonic anhydrase
MVLGHEGCGASSEVNQSDATAKTPGQSLGQSLEHPRDTRLAAVGSFSSRSRVQMMGGGAEG